MNGPTGGFSGGMAGPSQSTAPQDDRRLFQIILHELKQKWNPQGWQQEMTPTERATSILQMLDSPFNYSPQSNEPVVGQLVGAVFYFSLFKVSS